MSKDHHNAKGSPKDSAHGRNAMDMGEIEKVFGTPNSPRSGLRHDHHTVTNEKNHPATHVAHKQAANESKSHAEHHYEATHPAQPLLEPPKNHQTPPLAGPEVDDLDADSTPTTPYPGIDDGLLEPGDKTHGHDGGEHDEKDDGDRSVEEGHVGEDDINGLSPRFGVDNRPLSPIPGSIPDVNTYQQKKNLAQGMMDLALLSANANQLRYVLETATGHPYYYFSLTFITLSIVFQVAVGVGLIMNSRYDVKDEKEICKADKINNLTVLGVFLITIVNVFITSFSVANTNNIATSVTPAAAVQQAG